MLPDKVMDGLVLTFSLVEDLERLQDFMVDALDDAHLGAREVIQGPQIERHAPELGSDFGVQVP